MPDRRKFGALGEQFAADLFSEEGYRILERNFRCRMGEADIICAKNNEIIFAEVKTRMSLTMGRPAESVNSVKKRHLKNTAAYYLQQNQIHDKNVSFQVIEILVNQIRDLSF